MAVDTLKPVIDVTPLRALPDAITVAPMEQSGWKGWQERWDRQQEVYLIDRERRFEVMFDVVEAVIGPAPQVLELACGTGSISIRLLRRLPQARTVCLDLDPALLRIAATLAGDDRVMIVRADLATRPGSPHCRLDPTMPSSRPPHCTGFGTTRWRVCTRTWPTR